MNTMPPALTAAEMNPWLNKLEMIRACAAQLQKDMYGYGLEIEFSGNAHTAYSELFEQLCPFIQEAMKRPSFLGEILYRVDVREDWAEQAKIGSEPYHHSLSRLILWRELQKVITRYLISRES